MAMPERRLRRLGKLAVLGIVLAGCQATASSAEPSESPTSSSAPSTSQAASPSTEPSIGPTGWRQISASGGPAAREDHTWTAAADGEVAYLFGGRDLAGGGTFADLWAYDLAEGTWQQLAGGPPARSGHSAAVVPGVGLVIFAGQLGAAFYNDLWAYDPTTGVWRQLPASGAVPVPRYGTCAALGPDGRLWISHGFTSDGTRFADTKAYDFGTAAWTEETPVGDMPVVRCLHGCWWTDDGQLTLYAGQTTGTTSLADRWELTIGERPGTNGWTELSGLLPPPRNLYAVTRWDAGAVVFGGQALDAGYLGDTWQLVDDGTVVPFMPEASAAAPAARSGAELVADPQRGRLLLFGGRDASSHFGDVWELTLP